MLEDPAAIMKRHRRTGVLVDTGLLLVYVVGLYDYATGYKVTNDSKYTKGNYGPDDSEILDLILNEFHLRITTPYVLAEVSNLIKLLPAGADTFCRELLRDTIPVLEEHYVPANELVEEDAFLIYGVADTSILKAAEHPYLVLTDDFKLSGYMSSQGMDVLNFHHIKDVVV